MLKNRAVYFKQRRERMKSTYVELAKGRICAKEGCGTILNSYNLNICCSLHNFEYVIQNKIKVSDSLTGLG